jgi:hypothetical protein
VEPEAAHTLIGYWLRHRHHVSEDITHHLESVELQTAAMVRDAYEYGGVPVRAWQYVERQLDAFFNSRRNRDAFFAAYTDRIRRPGKVPSAVRDDAFRILQRFYRARSRQLNLGWREFAHGAGKNNSRDCERLLANGTWLDFVDGPVKGKKSRTYRLQPTVWPARPREPRVFVRP